ncbi:hypothetical protein [Verrucomicrobium spinosum]|uniref:hypothetical protein n=1 Tax=Verrucomicrobium spinosum TaxID=2736 RepID=UPI000174471A|nr:hypothetical protein [Verrucomicrobium spinosum]
MKEHPEDPKEWYAIWRSGTLAGLQFWQGLLYTANFHDAEAVVSVLDDKELGRFKDFLWRITREFDPDSNLDEVEMMTIGDPPIWKMSDAFKLRTHLEERDYEKAEDWLED